MDTVRDLLCCSRTLPGDSPRRDGEILLGHCLGKSRAWLYTWPDRKVEPALAERYRKLLSRRQGGEPVAYLVGQREFWTMELAVDASTLIPRPETEVLVEWALELALPGNAEVVDLGTGSGAIALALGAERPGWRIEGVDVSAAALEVAAANARRHGLDSVVFSHSDWFAELGPRHFHLVVSNPPYIDAADPHLGRGDVRFEPRSALVAAGRGLGDLAAIVEAAPDHLYPGGWLLLEHGYEQGPAVREMLDTRGFSGVSTRQDLSGQPRVSGGVYGAQ